MSKHTDSPSCALMIRATKSVPPAASVSPLGAQARSYNSCCVARVINRTRQNSFSKCPSPSSAIPCASPNADLPRSEGIQKRTLPSVAHAVFQKNQNTPGQCQVKSPELVLVSRSEMGRTNAPSPAVASSSPLGQKRTALTTPVCLLRVARNSTRGGCGAGKDAEPEAAAALARAAGEGMFGWTIHICECKKKAR